MAEFPPRHLNDHRRSLFMSIVRRYTSDVCGFHNLRLLTLLRMAPVIHADQTLGYNGESNARRRLVKAEQVRI